MTDPELIEKKLARIETCVRELGRPDALATDIDLSVVRDVFENRLDDLLAFVAAARARLG